MNIASARPVAKYLYIGIFITASLAAVGQALRPISIGGVLIPKPTGVLGKQDAAALAEVTAHRVAVGGTPWEGMQGTGTITFGPRNSAYSASLSNLRSDMFRLDVQDQGGVTSTRIHGAVGKSQGPDGITSSLPVNAALAGIYPFERLRNVHLSSSEFSLLDGGIVTVGTAQLHRVTLEYRAVGKAPGTRTDSTLATDFYLDPVTHLLVKSACLQAAPSGRAANFLVVVSYDDYRTVGTSLIPFRYTETLEGQPYSTLQLSSVEAKPSLTSKYFEF